MTTHFVTTNQTTSSPSADGISDSGSPLVSVSNGDEVIIAPGVLLGSGTNLVDFDDSNLSVTFHGAGYGRLGAVTMTIASGDAPDNFSFAANITQTGSLTSEGFIAFFGIFATSVSLLDPDSLASFNNAGTAISTESGGVFYQSVGNAIFNNTGTLISESNTSFGNSVSFTNVINALFTNSGSITGNNQGIGSSNTATVGFEAGAQNVSFSNAGIITGPVAALVSDANATEDIYNSGTIVGDVDLSNFTGVTSVLQNTGLIQGDVDTRRGDDMVTNSGQIDGQLYLDEGDDFYFGAADGFVTGTVFGEDGADTLVGGSQADGISGGEDADQINGGGGDDYLTGELGDDTINGGSGSDSVFGDEGADNLRGDDGDDELNGGTGDDTIRAGSGNDTLDGGDDEDDLRGSSGNDELNGNADDDTLHGGSGEDELNGGDGFDRLYGDGGNDQVFGGLARDVLFGGRGEDVFIYTSQDDSTSTEQDGIRDFQRGQDLIDLSDSTGLEIVFNGTAAFTGGGTASIRYDVNSSNQAILRGDLDGDGLQDLKIKIFNTTELTADDFIL